MSTEKNIFKTNILLETIISDLELLTQEIKILREEHKTSHRAIWNLKTEVDRLKARVGGIYC